MRRSTQSQPSTAVAPNPDRDLVIGEGILTWNRGERISDRYGTIYLMAGGGNSLVGEDEVHRPVLRTPDGEPLGHLVAEVVATRESTHIGDLFRGIFPSTPTVGDLISLGTGRLFREEYSVGLRPEEARDSDWLDPCALYRCHEQTVKLWFVAEEPSRA